MGWIGGWVGVWVLGLVGVVGVLVLFVVGLGFGSGLVVVLRINFGCFCVGGWVGLGCVVVELVLAGIYGLS